MPDHPQGWDTCLLDVSTWAFVQAMLEAGEFPDTDELLAFLEKPWKWAPVQEQWVMLGRPGPDDATWQEWLDYLIERVGGPT
jgi:hypothetical protein